MPKRSSSQAGYSQRTQPSQKKKLTIYRAPYSTKPYIIGKTSKASLRYSQNGTITGSAVQGSIGTWIMSANGCYDPDITGVGHQPRGFDQLMTLYDHYTVTNATITVRFVNNSTNSRPYVGIAVRDSSSAFVDLVGVAEYSNMVLSRKPLGRITTLDSAGDSSFTSLTTRVNVSSFLGRKNAMSDPELKGSASSNPAEQVYFHVIAGDPHASTPASIDIFTSVTYDVVFHEPKQPLSS